jgi:hypothetical protein
MSSSSDGPKPGRRVFLLGGLGAGLAAGALGGWAAAQAFMQGRASARDADLSLTDKQALSTYCNFARVTATAEEVIIDFCLNPNPFAEGRQELPVSQRVVLNFVTAKELFEALGKAVLEQEKAHGPIELDVKKRVKPGRK